MAAQLSHTRRRRTPAARLLAAVAAGAMLVGGFAATGAQDAMEAHPAHIHAGTCAELGEVVFPLTDVGETGMMDGMMAGTPEAGAAETEMGEPTGAETAFAVETSSTLVDAPLAEIVEGGHAINVHQSAENIDNYIACGDLGGRIATGPGTEQGGTLVVGLGQLNASGASGIAVLEGQGDRTEVVLYLARGLAGGTTGTTEGTPAAAAPAAEEVVVDIENFAFGYDPDRVAIPVGGTVTWTNGDAAPHTATGRDREALQSSRLDQGDSYSQTFDEPGTYEYFCEIHPNMRGTVVVG
jgi:plastocyanin